MAHAVDRLKSTGWIWVLIAAVAVALLVWWVAAAVDDTNRGEPGQQMAEFEPSESRSGSTQQTSGQVQEGEATVGTQDAPGQTRRFGEGAAPERLEQYVSWVEQQDDEPRVDPAFVVRGMDLLVNAVDDVIDQARQYEEVQQGERRGGGPLGGALDSPEFDQYYQAAQQSVGELERAEDARRPAAFNTAATDVAALLAQIQERTGATGADEQVERLQQAVHAIRPDQPLDEQAERIHQYFDRSAQATLRLTGSFQPDSPGAITPPDNP